MELVLARWAVLQYYISKQNFCNESNDLMKNSLQEEQGLGAVFSTNI